MCKILVKMSSHVFSPSRTSDSRFASANAAISLMILPHWPCACVCVCFFVDTNKVSAHNMKTIKMH